MIFEFALKNDFIDVNKVKFIELGKFKKVVDRKIFTKDEIEILFNNLNSNAKSKKLVYIILILIYTGLRIGELLKLKIEDIRKDAQKVRPYDSIWDMYYDEFDDMEEI